VNLPKILESLAHFEADARPSGDVGRLIFSHEMAKSCGLLSLLSEHYDVALMNPPYGSMPPDCKDYCAGNRGKRIPAHYPKTGNNLYSAFMEKCIELIDESGFVGMLTSQTFMYLTTFKKTRNELLNPSAPLEVLCDTGFDVLDGAKVVTAASVIRKQRMPDHDRPCACIRMFQESEDRKESVLIESLEHLRKGKPHPRVFLTSVNLFKTLPQSVYAYWVPGNIASLFTTYPPLDRDVIGRQDVPKVADANVGMQTGDDPRFVRFFWEVTLDSIGTDRSSYLAAKKWCPFAKGGWLEAYQADVDRVVKWAEDGEELRQSSGAFIRNERF